DGRAEGDALRRLRRGRGRLPVLPDLGRWRRPAQRRGRPWQFMTRSTAMKWITREKVKVDRVACPWLIRRFIDPQAEFMFVPAEQVMERAAQEGATPFDVLGVASTTRPCVCWPRSSTARTCRPTCTAGPRLLA